ncbi:MAG: hypothetical protein R3298_06865 [Gammaproteobacteria bacterium]|nr:hypothetical protein [Gammaproteobacteria bacterium]
MATRPTNETLLGKALEAHRAGGFAMGDTVPPRGEPIAIMETVTQACAAGLTPFSTPHTLKRHSTREAQWMGMPVVALAVGRHRARVGVASSGASVTTSAPGGAARPGRRPGAPPGCRACWRVGVP